MRFILEIHSSTTNVCNYCIQIFTVQNKNTKRMAYFNDKKPDLQEQGKYFAGSSSQWNPVVYSHN